MKARYIIGFALAAAALVASCGKKDGNHAPVCPYGQVLTYGDTGYQCQFVSLQQPQQNFYGASQCNQQQQQGQANVLVAPTQQCLPDAAQPNEPQSLVNWYGTFFCYKNRTIYPSGDNSPGGRVPPVGVGGESCTAGYFNNSNQAFNGGAFNNGILNNNTNSCNPQIACSPGYYCQATGAAAQNSTQSPTGLPYSNGFGSGQAGTCVLAYH